MLPALGVKNDGLYQYSLVEIWHFVLLALILHSRKQLDGLSLAPLRSMRKVRATQSIPLVNVQGVGDGRVDVEENNRPVQAR